MNLLRVLATVSGMTFISRVLGFVRDADAAVLHGEDETVALLHDRDVHLLHHARQVL